MDANYEEYLKRKIAAQREHMDWLRDELAYAKRDKWEGWVTAFALLAVLAVTWAYWPAAQI